MAHGPDQLTLSWLPRLPGESLGCKISLEDELSRAIETSDESALSLLRKWRAKDLLASSCSLGTDSRGLTAVQVAIVFKRHRILSALLDSKTVDINQPSTNAAKKGWTALHFAAFLMDLRAIEILLSYNCDTSLLTTLGSTPLHFLTGRFGNRGDHLQHYVKKIMNTLIEAGVNPFATNKYGFTVLHEIIMWSDVTSLCVLIQSKHFKRLLLLGTTLLPHELGWKSTLPDNFKRLLERNYFSQKMLTPTFTAHDFHIYEIIECVSRPSPPTVERLGFQHPECLTAGEVWSLVKSAPQMLVIEALKYQQSIQEYYHSSSREYRYVFPAYFPASLPNWVCADCRDCRIVAGRWLEMPTKTVAKNFLLHMITAVLSKASFSQSATVSSGAYFRTVSKIQLGIQCIDRVRSVGIMIHVCSGKSSSPEIASECQSVLNFVVQLAYDLKRNIGSVAGPVSLVSSRDLRAGKKIPHLFTLSEVNEARKSSKSFLSNPACLNKAETFVDLLLFDPQALQETDECESAKCITSSSLQETAYYQPAEWKQEVYVKAVNDHGDDIAKLLDADLVADHLVSEGIFSPEDQSDLSTASDKVSCLLEKVQSKNAHHSVFSILLQTGTKVPAHGRLFDILYDTCEEIARTGSLHNWYLEGHMAAQLEQRSEDGTTATPIIDSAVRPRTWQSGRVTEESGYGTHDSVTSPTRPPSSFKHHPPVSDTDPHLSVGNVGSLPSLVASSIYLNGSFEDEYFHEGRDFAASVTKHSTISRSNSTSSPITIPRRSSSFSSSYTQYAAEPADVVTKVSILSSHSTSERFSADKRKSTVSSSQQFSHNLSQQLSYSSQHFSCSFQQLSSHSSSPDVIPRVANSSVKDVTLESCVYESADDVDVSFEEAHGEMRCDTTTSVTLSTSSVALSSPIAIPNSTSPSSSSRTPRAERDSGVMEKIHSSSSSTPKHLPNATGLLHRFLDAMFARDGDDDSFSVLPGVKPIF